MLLYHVVEGRLDGFEVAVFDFPTRGGTQTGVIVSGLPVADAPGAPKDGALSFDRQDGHLLGFRPAVRIENLPALVESVMSVSR